MGARPLRAGGTIEVIAPASAFERDGFDEGTGLLQRRGFQVRFRPDIFSRERFLAGNDARRLEELNEALESDSDVIWCARGGYGTTRLLPELSIARIRAANKLLIGFSDDTALQVRWAAAGVPSLHASMVARIAKEPADIVERLFQALEPGKIATPITGDMLVPGRAEGWMTGGNLMVLSSLCGTPYQPDFAGAILLLEDVGERSYRLDRTFVQCTQAGLFRGIAGLAFGTFTSCGEPEISAASVIEEHAGRIGVPAIQNLPVGHGDINQAVPLGVRARIDDGRLEFLEPLT